MAGKKNIYFKFSTFLQLYTAQFETFRSFCTSYGCERQNKTKYTMDPGIYYLLEADEDNTNRY